MNNTALEVSSSVSIDGAKNVSYLVCPAPHPLFLGAVFDGFHFIFLFPFYDGIADVLKRPPFYGSFIWDRTSEYFQYWKFKKEIIQDYAEDFIHRINNSSPPDLYCEVDDFSEIISYIVANPSPIAFLEKLSLLIYSLSSGGTATVGSYHPGVIAVLKQLNGRYLSSMKAWTVPNSKAFAIKHTLMSELALRDDQIEVVDGVCKITKGNFTPVNLDGPSIHTFDNLIPSGNEDSPLEEVDNSIFLAVTTPLAPSNLSIQAMAEKISAFDLYDYQRAGVQHLISNSSALLADDMGLGKTRQAVAAASIVAESAKILIACPASLIINWIREIRLLFPDATIAQQEFDPACQWVVTNYERLNLMIKHASSFKVLITDEAHLLKEPSSKRTRLAFDVASKIPYRFLLTGTPILNRECEIHTLLRLSGHPVGNIPLREFQEQFAGDSAFRAALNLRISEWMLRRKKDVVLKSLKGKKHHVSFIAHSAKQRAAYDACAKDNSLIALAKIVRLRVILESIKLDTVIDFIGSLSPSDKCLVFCEFKETVADLKKYFENSSVGVVSLIGSDSLNKRQAAIDAFQSNPDVHVFVGTTAAAGIGHNLTEANYVIFASLPWTPALMEQAEDRAYRNGQQRAVIVKIPLLEDSIDVDLWEMLKNKKSISNDIIDPEAASAAAMNFLAGTVGFLP